MKPDYMKLTFPIILVLGLLSGLTPLAIDAYLPSIPTISKSLNTDIGLVQMTLSMYLLVFALLQIVFGPISDAIGRRKVIVGGLTVFALGSFLCAITQSYEMLLVGRAIQAFGGAAVAVCVPALVKDGMSINQFAKAMSMVMLVMALAPLAAPIIGGAILTILNWHYIFVFLGILAILAMILFLRTIPETLPADKRTPFSLLNAIRNYIMLLKNRAVMGYAVFFVALRRRNFVQTPCFQLAVDNVVKRVRAPIHWIGCLATRPPAAAPLICEQHFGTIIVERRRMPVSKI